jgi:Icc protein
MPGMCQQKLNRRQLLKGGLALAAGAMTFGPRAALGEDRDGCTRWAFLSDTHIAADPDDRYRGFCPYRNLQEITSRLDYDLPEGVVITGDLARLKGRPEAYANVKSLLTPLAQKRPVYLGLGNHDNRDDFFHAFGGTGRSGEVVENKHVITADGGPVRLIILDTLDHINAISGLLGWPQRTWLETYLRMCDDTPTILFLHHTPKVDLRDTGLLFRIIGPMTKVKAVVYGHTHQVGLWEYKGIHLINLPAAGYNLGDSHPVGWMEATLTAQGGEFLLHAMAGNTRYDGLRTTLTWRS